MMTLLIIVASFVWAVATGWRLDRMDRLRLFDVKNSPHASPLSTAIADYFERRSLKRLSDLRFSAKYQDSLPRRRP